MNILQKLDVAQWGNELAILYTNIRLRHQRNRVPSHLLTDYSDGLLGDCSKLLRFRNIWGSPSHGIGRAEASTGSDDSRKLCA